MWLNNQSLLCNLAYSCMAYPAEGRQTESGPSIGTELSIYVFISDKRMKLITVLVARREEPESVIPLCDRSSGALISDKRRWHMQVAQGAPILSPPLQEDDPFVPRRHSEAPLPEKASWIHSRMQKARFPLFLNLATLLCDYSPKYPSRNYSQSARCFREPTRDLCVKRRISATWAAL